MIDLCPLLHSFCLAILLAYLGLVGKDVPCTGEVDFTHIIQLHLVLMHFSSLSALSESLL